MEVVSLHIYPVKGCKGISLTEAKIGTRCFEYDRHWIIVDATGEKITQREEPRLALIKTEIHDATLTLSAQGHGKTHIDINTVPEKPKSVDVWGDDSPGLVERIEASQWLTDFLKQPVTLLRFDESKRRDVIPEWGGGESGAHIAFNDCLPLLITNTHSLDSLNDWRAQEGLVPSQMDRFRPNIVVTAVEPWEEDTWPALEFENGALLEITRPCSRCRVPNVDQETGVPEETGNLQILGKRRLFKNYLGRPGAMFGVQGLVRGCEGKSVRLGDKPRATQQSLSLPNVPRLSR